MSGPNALVFVRRNGLIIAGKRVASARLKFDPKVVENMEVLNKQKLVATCKAFFTEQNLDHRKVLMVLDQDITFEKVLSTNKLVDAQTELDNFLTAMPFDVGKRAGFSVSVDEVVRLYATNYELIFAIAEAIEAAGAKVIATTPLTLYGLEPGQQLKNVVSKLLRDTVVRKQANFARNQPI
jgi:hypothetical protein